MTRRRVTLPLTLSLTGALALGLGAAAPVGASAPPAPGSSYVALGDSFSAGTGTRASTDDCYRSPYGYPALLAQAHGLDLDYQACSGAAIPDVHAHQLQALSPDTDYVTMTIGGNDLGYAEVITQCALPGWLSNCDGKINQALNVLRTQLPARYDVLFAEIGDRAPAAQVVVGSYPRLFNGRDCNLATFFSSSEMSRLNAATDELAGVIRDRTTAAGFRYVDARPAFVGHAVCDSTEWVNGLSMPIQESYHPNRAGNTGYAEIFWPGTGAASMSTSATTSRSATEVDRASSLRAQADAVLAMELDSPAHLRAARAEGVPPGQVTRLVAQLRSGNPDVIERALDGLAELDRQHEAHEG